MSARKARAKSKPSKLPRAPKASGSNVINLRADLETRTLIDRAAKVKGQNRTEFMLASARVRAQEVLLNEVYFELGEADWNALNACLDAPPPANAALKSLMSRTPSWKT